MIVELARSGGRPWRWLELPLQLEEAADHRFEESDCARALVLELARGIAADLVGRLTRLRLRVFF